MTWTIYDKKTGKRLTIFSYDTREQAEGDINDCMAQMMKGKRSDLLHLIDSIGAIEITHETYGSFPGDIIDGRDTS